jgi:AcrR family transcriptional regulator
MADRATRKKRITEQRQQQILAAAGEIFARKGYATATVPEIARLAGIASGTVYLYFPSKRELFFATIQQMMIAPLVNIFSQGRNIDFNSLLDAAISDRLEMMQHENFPRLVSFIGEIQRDDELNAMYVEKVVRPFLARMEAVYQPRIDSGELRKENAGILVRLIGSTVIGMIILRMLEGNTSPLNHMPKEELASKIKDFILFGISNPERHKEK